MCSAGNSNTLMYYGNNKKTVVLSSAPIKIRMIKSGLDGGGRYTMLRLYLAGPLFSEAERQYSKYLSNFFENFGFETFLPQRDGQKLSDLLANETTKSVTMNKIFNHDINELQKVDVVIFVMDGRVPDEGACVEIGYAYALGKECICLKTDPRTLMSDADNPLIMGALKYRIAKNLKELDVFLYKIKETEGISTDTD